MIPSVASLPLKPNSAILIAGSTGSGKTEWVYRLLRNADQMFEVPPTCILYCYATYQKRFDDMLRDVDNLTFHQGLPSVMDIKHLAASGDHSILVLDDLAEETVESPVMLKMFTTNCHHMGITTLFIMQNIFTQGKFARSISLNAHYIVLLKSLRDVNQISYLGRQLFSKKAACLEESFRECTKTPYGYLLVDLSPHSDDRFRLRTNIFPGEYSVIYQAKEQ